MAAITLEISANPFPAAEAKHVTGTLPKNTAEDVLRANGAQPNTAILDAPSQESQTGALRKQAAEKASNNDLNGAIKDLTEVIRLSPGDPRAYCDRADHRASVGFNQITEVYRSGIDLQTFDKIAAIRATQFNEAIADYDKAIELNPNFPRAYYERGWAKMQKGDFEGARADYETWKQIDRAGVDGSKGVAVVDYSRSLAQHIELVGMMNFRAQVELGALNFDNAIQGYSVAIAVTPQSDELYNSRGYAKLLKGDLKGAEADFVKATQLNPENVDARENLKSIKKKSAEGEV
jgi:Flp pilus assembly protein TadD